MTKCPICKNDIVVISLRCNACGVSYRGAFVTPRLARLTREEMVLTEALVLHGGNLKGMAEDINVSYPTLKKRLKELSNSLAQKKQQDEVRIEEILKEIELGKTGAEEGIRLIRELNGEL